MTVLPACNPEDYLPHRTPALFVSGVLAVSDREISTKGHLPQNHPLVVEGSAPVGLAVEFAAQTAGVLIGLCARVEQNSKPDSGYLASVKNVNFSQARLASDLTLRAEVKLDGRFGALSMVRFSVSSGGEEVAVGNLAIATSR